MTAAGRLFNDPRTATVLAMIGQSPRSGLELATALNLTPGELAYVVEPLWTAKLLQGDIADGCCRDPCGTACVAYRMDRLWSLSRKGASTLRRRQSPEPAEAA